MSTDDVEMLRRLKERREQDDKLVAAVVAAEREACAKIADLYRKPGFHIPQSIAAAIRARGKA